MDLRVANSRTEKYIWPMPNIEVIFCKLSKRKYYFLIGLCHGYWKVPLDATSQDCQSILTAEEVITPTRVLQGQTNAVFYFQSVSQNLVRDMRDDILLWVGDVLGHSNSNF